MIVNLAESTAERAKSSATNEKIFDEGINRKESILQ
jgi:hypothetical protein